MIRKVPLGIVLALMLLTAAVTISLTVSYYTKEYNSLISDLPQRAQQYAQLQEVDELVRANYYGDLSAASPEQGVVRGYLESLDDPHSVYLSPEDYAIYTRMNSGEMPGVGLQAEFDISTETLRVTVVEEESPAAEKDVQIGDVIESADGEAVTRENVNAILLRLTSGRTGVVQATLRRGNDAPRRVNLQCGYKTPSCTYEKRGTLGYIRILRFSEDTLSRFQAAVKEFQKQDVGGLVIDVRNNDGNDIAMAVKVIDQIVPLATEGTGAIATEKNAAGETVEIYAADAETLRMPIAVLINSRTGGAAELLASDLRDFGMATLVGEPTMGHGTVQRVFELRDGSALVLTVAEVVPYLGVSFNGSGVLPEVVVPMSADEKDRLFTGADQNDAQYRAAEAKLLG